jgi:hypothetical protein
MKKLFAILGLIFLLSKLEAIDLAVTYIEGLGVDRSVSRLVEDALQSELSRFPILNLVERSRLETVLKEQELEISGITNAQNASTIGGVLNVDKIVFGSIASYESEYITYVLSLRLVDVERARIEVADTFKVSLKEDLLEVVARAAESLVMGLEVVGKVTHTDDTGIYISLGKESGLDPGDSLSVFLNEKVLNDKGIILLSEETPVANLTVIRLSLEGSLCRVTSQSADPLPGMTVRPGMVKLQGAEEITGSIRVGSLPSGSNVFLNGEYVGLTPLMMENMNPGSYKVEIRSGEGYKSYTGKINLRSGRTVSVERELEREMEVEDMLAFGRIPRKQTDPWVAVRKALIPGMGSAYNGYPSSAAPLLMSMSLSGLGVLSYYMYDDLSINNLSDPYFQFYGAWFSLAYLGSIFNAGYDATEDFLFPAYYSISTSAAYSYLHDSLSYYDATVIGYGIMPEFSYHGRRFSFVLSLPLLIEPMTIRVMHKQNIFIVDEWAIGGCIYLSQLLNGRNPASFYSIWYPAFSVSYQTIKLEGDVLFSPVAVTESEEWKSGFFGKMDLRYYWTATNGIKLGTDVWVIDDGLGLLFYLGYTMRM